MATELRDTGIGVVGDMPLGTHFCLFYETKEDLLNLLIPYFKTGLENHEFCLYVASEPVTAEEAERALREAVPNFERYLAEGQIEIVSHLHWYLAGGHFDPPRVRQSWLDKLEQSLARGYGSMRFAGNAFWLGKQDWDSFADYERKIDEVFGELRIIVVCAYSLARCSAADMLDVVRHHQFSVARRHGNWERLEGLELQRSYAEIRELNAGLEHRVIERTAQLAAANEQLIAEITERKRTEEALRASEARLQAAIDAANIGLWDWDLISGQIIWLGHHDQLFGFADGEFDGTYASVEKRVHPEDLTELNGVVQRARAEGVEYAHEYRVIWPDGRIHWINGQGKFIYNEMGQPTRMYGAVFDITERKRVEETLRLLNRELRAVSSCNQTLLHATDERSLINDICRIVCNEAGYRMVWVGFAENDEAKTVRPVAWAGIEEGDLSTPDITWADTERGCGPAGKAIRSGETNYIQDFATDPRAAPWRETALHPGYYSGLAMPLKDENAHTFGAFKIYASKPDAFTPEETRLLEELAGDLAFGIITLRTRAERKRAEEALRQAHQEYVTLVNSIDGIVWQADAYTFAFDFVSQQAERLLGYPAEQWLAEPTFWQDHLHPDDREWAVDFFVQQISQKRPHTFEYRMMAVDGRAVWLRDIVSVVVENDRPVRLRGIMVDITEGKQAEEEIRWHAARMEALDGISKALSECGLGVQAVLNAIARHTAEIIGDTCVIRLLSGDEQGFQPVAFHNPDPKIRTLIESAYFGTPVSAGGNEWIAHVLRTGEGMLVSIIDQEQLRQVAHPRQLPFIEQVGMYSFVGVPLRVEGRVIGTLTLTRDRPGHSYTSDDQVFLQDLADRAALTVQNARLFEQVQGAQRRLQTLSDQLLAAQEVERRAIARELHDEIGQVLTAVNTNLQAIQLSRDASTLAARLEESIALVDDALSRTRDLSLDLRPSMLDDFGLVSALEWYIDRQAGRSGFEAKFLAEPPEMRLPPSLETTVFRVAQIALTNVARHAHANHVRVKLRQHESELELVIRDDGIGFDVASALERAAYGATLGLLSMQERVRLALGELEIKSTLGRGAEIRARFPVSEKTVIE